MTKEEALKLALEALVFNQANWQGKDKAITAIKEALAQPEQKPVAWEQFYPDMGKPQLIPPQGIYYTPPQRTWVGLRDDEIYSVLENLQVIHHRPPTTDSRVIFAQAIEAKLKEKNT